MMLAFIISCVASYQTNGIEPIFIWPDETYDKYPSAAPSDGSFWVTLQYNSPPASPMNFSWPLIYVNDQPTNPNVPTTGASITVYPTVEYAERVKGHLRFQYTGTPQNPEYRYGLYKHIDLLEMMYVAFHSCLKDLVKVVPHFDHGKSVGVNFVAETGLIQLYIPAMYVADIRCAKGDVALRYRDDHINVYLNYELASFMPNFRGNMLNRDAHRLNYWIEPRLSYLNKESCYIVNTQEASTLHTWSAIAHKLFNKSK